MDQCWTQINQIYDLQVLYVGYLTGLSLVYNTECVPWNGLSMKQRDFQSFSWVCGVVEFLNTRNVSARNWSTSACKLLEFLSVVNRLQFVVLLLVDTRALDCISTAVERTSWFRWKQMSKVGGPPSSRRSISGVMRWHARVARSVTTLKSRRPLPSGVQFQNVSLPTSRPSVRPSAAAAAAAASSTVGQDANAQRRLPAFGAHAPISNACKHDDDFAPWRPPSQRPADVTRTLDVVISLRRQFYDARQNDFAPNLPYPQPQPNWMIHQTSSGYAHLVIKIYWCCHLVLWIFKFGSTRRMTLSVSNVSTMFELQYSSLRCEYLA